MLTRKDLERLTRELFDSLADFGPNGERNLERISAHFADELAYRIPFLPAPVELGTRKAFLEVLAKTNGLFAASHYKLEKLLIDEVAQTVVVEATSLRPLRTTGAVATFSYVFIFAFDGNLINEMREYVFSTDIEMISKAMDLESFAARVDEQARDAKA